MYNKTNMKKLYNVINNFRLNAVIFVHFLKKLAMLL